MPDLKQTIALVTGATRGCGRGVALALASYGATVVVTGRSTRAHPHAQGFPRTIEDTAEEATARGGRGVAIPCDHTDDAQVQALVDRVIADHGRIDVLVNNAWGGHETPFGEGPFWELPIAHWDGMFEGGVRCGIVASQRVAPHMARAGRGLIVHTTSWDRGLYLDHFFYDLAKATLGRMAFGMAHDLRPHGVACVALAPGWMRTELVLQAFGASEATWQDVPDLATTETPEYGGRGVAHLAADPDVLKRSGQILHAGDLAADYGFTDADGRQPPTWRKP